MIASVSPRYLIPVGLRRSSVPTKTRYKNVRAARRSSRTHHAKGGANQAISTSTLHQAVSIKVVVTIGFCIASNVP
jgi:hypothetical protein